MQVWRDFRNEVDRVPFLIGVVVTLGFVSWAAFDTETVASWIDWAQFTVGEHLAWLYLGSVLAMLIFAGYLMFSKYGKIRLGEGPPEYGTFAYFAMFFSAGLSAGIVFFGPAEALWHYEAVPPVFGDTIGAETTKAIVPAVTYSVFHYGVSAWAGYLAIGIPVAYFAYRYNAPFRVSTALLPVLGRENLDGVIGRTVDTLAVVATIGGIATGLGFISLQLLDGITLQTGYEFSSFETILAITAITVLFTISVVAGISRGIRRLSGFNVIIMSLLLIVVLVGGPTVNILNTGISAVGTYINHFFEMSLFTGVGSEAGTGWAASWTVFYWAWWIAWAPFVGLFLARISKGRTIRSVIGTAFVTMTIISLLWFSVVGGGSVWMQHTGAVDILQAINTHGEGVSGYVLFGSFPGGAIWQALFFVLVVTFFATSADSSTLALGMLTTGGKMTPSSINRVFWSVLQGMVASVLVVLGGVTALRSSVIVTGAPFAVVCIVAISGLAWWLRTKHGKEEKEHLSGRSETDHKQAAPATDGGRDIE